MSTLPLTAESKASLKAYQGQHAVYRATGCLLPVTIDNVTITDRLLRAKLRPLISPLIRWHNMPSFFEPFEAASVWKYVSIEPGEWNAPFIGWYLTVKPGAYEAVLRLCEAEKTISPQMLFQLADFVSRCPHVSEIPQEVRERAAQSTCQPRGFEPR
jgi:hypothetical protein